MFSRGKLFILFFLIVVSLSTAAVIVDRERDKRDFLATYSSKVQRAYQFAQNQLNHSNSHFYSLNEERIAKTFLKASQEPDRQQAVREQLLDTYINYYENMRTSGLRTLQLHLPDSNTFLRFESPGHPNLQTPQPRDSVQQANRALRHINGLEFDRERLLYRSLYPLFHNGIHAGALELGFSFKALAKKVNGYLAGNYFLLLDPERLPAAHQQHGQQNRAIQFPLATGPNRVAVDLSGDPERVTALNSAVASLDGLTEQLATQQIFSRMLAGNGTEIIASFMPIYSMAGEQIGHLAGYSNPLPPFQRFDYRLPITVLAVVSLFFGGFMYWSNRVARLNDTLQTQSRELQRLSVTDSLTGIANRLKIDTIMGAEFERYKRFGSFFTVILLDLDHFKQVNDTHGHQAGDRVLQETATILDSKTRSVDFTGRWGGEEFIIVCPQTTLDQGMIVAEHLRAAMADHRFPDVGSQTASFGVSSVLVNDPDEQAVIKRADEALYRAKKQGRNRVSQAG